ncbi:hypothetical protein [Neisseria cinerea]|uniref:hypothetical protein n=1 Tax=Neisseria cinerea TaxID=483 RepID=UPI0027DF883F|nr:hypothetical protein [Neisseria cinerea]
MNKKINKRVSVGFSEEEYRVLRELSEQNGKPMSKIVYELVFYSYSSSGADDGESESSE